MGLAELQIRVCSMNLLISHAFPFSPLLRWGLDTSLPTSRDTVCLSFHSLSSLWFLGGGEWVGHRPVHLKPIHLLGRTDSPWFSGLVQGSPWHCHPRSSAQPPTPGDVLRSRSLSTSRAQKPLFPPSLTHLPLHTTITL